MTEARTFSGGNCQGQLAALLKFHPSNVQEVCSRFTAVHATIDETGELLKNLDPEQHELFKSSEVNIRRFFSLPTGNDWNQHKQSYLRTEDLRTLSFCSLTLSRRVPERTVEANDLKELESELEALYQSVIDAKIDAPLRVVILDALNGVRNAIHEYRIRGTKELKKSLIVVVGTAKVYDFARDQATEAPAADGRKNWTDQFWKFVGHCAMVLNIGNSVLMLAPHAAQFIEVAAKISGK